MQTMNQRVVISYLISRTRDRIVLSNGDKDVELSVIISPEQDTLLSQAIYMDIVSCTIEDDPIAEGDEETEEKQFRMIGTPLITRSVAERKHVIGAMISSVKREGKLLIIPARVVRFYELIHQNLLTSELPTVSEYLSYKANLYNCNSKKDVLSSITSDYAQYADWDKLLRGWYMRNDIRLLLCLGIDKELIRSCYYRTDMLYSLYIENPLLVHCVPLEQAVKMCELLRINPAEYMHAGEALRELARLTIGNSNTCVSCNMFYRKVKLNEAATQQLLDYAAYPETCDKQDVLYLKEVRDMEITVASRLHELFTSQQPPIGNLRPSRADDILVYDSEQARAVEQAINNNVSIVTGEAGTGKTTIIKKLIACLRLNNVPFACTSFTGKATARISECCNVDASDMDMMIVKSSEQKFSHLIIDEFSMTNIKLLCTFLQVFSGLYRITIIGDPNQLEPIGPGSVLKELLKSNTIPTTRLKTIYRVVTAEGLTDRIIENSKRIAYWGTSPFLFVEGDNFEVRDGSITELMAELKSMKANRIPTSNFVVISPFNAPISIINRAVQVLYCRRTKCCIKRGNKWTVQGRGTQLLEPDVTIFHIGDRIMVLKNYERDGIKMHNGQEGIVIDISSIGVTANVKGEKILFPFSSPEAEINISFIELCYAVTVHKMQGSQRKRVIYFLHRYSSFVTRRMTYTAITRAENSVLLLGDPADFNKSVDNLPRDKKEYLYWRMRQLLPEDYSPDKDERMKEELLKRQYLLNLEAAADMEDEDYDDYDD